MIITVPDSIKQFAKKYLSKLGNNKSELLPLYVAGFLLGVGKRTYTTLGSTIFLEQRHKTAVSKFFRRKTFNSREILDDVLKKIIFEELKLHGMSGEWVLLIDGTCTRRGGFTKIGNAIQYKEKKQSIKGRSTKAHTFVMGELISPHGRRYPVRFSFYTKDYCKEKNIPYKTQNDIAMEIVDLFRQFLPPVVQLVVIADSYFDSKKMFECTDRKNTVFITSTDRDRTHKLRYGTEKLHERAKDMKKPRTFILTKGDEPYTRKQCRFSHPEMKGKIKQRYSVTGEALNVSGIGKCRVVYSWKKKSGKNNSGQSLRVILCSNTSWSDEKVAEFYALRWQIEIFFRELKSDLGLNDFCGQDFESFERYVDVCLLSFVFLEWHRAMKIEATHSRKEKSQLTIIRTRGLKSLIRQEAVQETFRALERLKLVA